MCQLRRCRHRDRVWKRRHHEVPSNVLIRFRRISDDRSQNLGYECSTAGERPRKWPCSLLTPTGLHMQLQRHIEVRDGACHVDTHGSTQAAGRQEARTACVSIVPAGMMGVLRSVDAG